MSSRRSPRTRRAFASAAVVLLLAAACGDDGDAADDPTDTEPDPTPSEPVTTEPVAPAPAAPHGIGTTEVIFTDTSRPTPRSGDYPGAQERAIDTVLFYPTAGDPADGAVPDAEPDRDHGPYPLVVFSHGLGGRPEQNVDVIAAWVSAGFVVAAPRFPLSRADAPSGPDGGDIDNQPGDVSFLITELTGDGATGSAVEGLVDAERVGAAGHSNGAITTLGVGANTCCLDERLDAAVVMAGTPSPFVGGEYTWESAPPMLVVHGTDDVAVRYDEGVFVFNSVSSPKGILTIVDGDHGSWFGSGDAAHDDVATATTDFLLAYVAGDLEAEERLARAETSTATELLFAPPGGDPLLIPTTTTLGGRRVATAEPTTGLVDGQLVTVTWTGFDAGGTINILQCARGGQPGAGACDLVTGHVLQPNPTGEGSIELEIVVGDVGDGTCGPGITQCVILVNDSGLLDDEAFVEFPLEFAS